MTTCSLFDAIEDAFRAGFLAGFSIANEDFNASIPPAYLRDPLTMATTAAWNDYVEQMTERDEEDDENAH